jgi:hypothetical protein
MFGGVSRKNLEKAVGFKSGYSYTASAFSHTISLKGAERVLDLMDFWKKPIPESRPPDWRNGIGWERNDTRKEEAPNGRGWRMETQRTFRRSVASYLSCLVRGSGTIEKILFLLGVVGFRPFWVSHRLTIFSSLFFFKYRTIAGIDYHEISSPGQLRRSLWRFVV